MKEPVTKLTQGAIKKRLLTKGEGVMADVVDRIYEFRRHAVSPILITGLSGSGKEFAARLLLGADQKEAKYQSVNCAAIEEQLLTAELFGHVKGSFTGADADRPGILLSGCDTLFLDEIDKTSHVFQNALLRLLRNREIRPVGSDKCEPLDSALRMVFASSLPASALFQTTHAKLGENLNARVPGVSDSADASIRNWRQSLWDELDEETSRNTNLSVDFLNRVTGAVVDMPPLRQRWEDMWLLLKYFMEKYGKELNRQILKVEGEFIHFIMTYSWPNNISELESFVRSGVMFMKNGILSYEAGMRLYGAQPIQTVIAVTGSDGGYHDSRLVVGYLGLLYVDDKSPTCGNLFRVQDLERVFENIFALSRVSEDDNEFDHDKVLKYFKLRQTLKTKKEAYTRIGFKSLGPFNTWRKRHHI